MLRPPLREDLLKRPERLVGRSGRNLLAGNDLAGTASEQGDALGAAEFDASEEIVGQFQDFPNGWARTYASTAFFGNAEMRPVSYCCYERVKSAMTPE